MPSGDVPHAWDATTAPDSVEVTPMGYPSESADSPFVGSDGSEPESSPVSAGNLSEDAPQGWTIRPVTTSAATQVRGSAGPEEDLRVLVAEDYEVSRKLLCRMLVRCGIFADEAVDGQEAVEMLAQNRYDLLLLDLSMPRLDGLGVLRWLRDHVTPEQRPQVVVISASALESAGSFAELGVFRVLPKPLHREQLIALLEDAREQQAARES